MFYRFRKNVMRRSPSVFDMQRKYERKIWTLEQELNKWKKLAERLLDEKYGHPKGDQSKYYKQSPEQESVHLIGRKHQW